MASQAVAILRRSEVIEALAKGQRLSDIAPALQVSPNAISKALKSDPEYRDALEAGFHCRLDRAEEAIEEATEQVDVARARARFTSVAWRAEREFAEVWSPKSQLHVSGSVTLDVILSALEDAPIEGETSMESVPAESLEAP